MKIGIIGCGFVCDQHLRALKRLQGISIVGVCDKDIERASAIAMSYKIPSFFGELTEMIEHTRPNVLHILTPPQSHFEITSQALEEGCHVLIEKPMAMNADEARGMIEISNKKGRVIGVCHNYIFIPAFLRAKKLLNRGVLGNIYGADLFWRMSSHGLKQRKLAAKWWESLPGGIYQEVMPHLIYIMRNVMGDLKLSSVIVGGNTNGEQNELRALLDTKNGPATIGLSLRSNPIKKFMKIYGTKASIDVDFATSVLVKQFVKKDNKVSRALLNLHHSVQIFTETLANTVLSICGHLPGGHEMLIKQFYESLRRGKAPPVNGEDGLATVTLLDEMWQAMK